MRFFAALALLFAVIGCSGEERGGPTPNEGNISTKEQSEAAPAKEGDQFNRYNASN